MVCYKNYRYIDNKVTIFSYKRKTYALDLMYILIFNNNKYICFYYVIMENGVFANKISIDNIKYTLSLT